ncbi:3-keto-5-aminohexanoate cleavage protein [Necropsobacter massiliensis]|uniref:3-keto-5-aminohexanoate cleavage protein n=1 Tax=Necropsobacter massiliensis TaxID=1400001 RepID=UPI0005958976|nr:3-keto-5-aminohexanoate cleavage protein [Necropsobacter massiliensis]
MSNKVILTAALTGAVTPKEIAPYIPITPQEIAEDAYRCWKAGASVVHLHMRDEQGLGCMDKHKFKEAVDRIKDKCDVIINITTSGDHRASDEQRMEHLAYVKPEIASFDAGSFNWMPDGVFMNSPQFLTKLGNIMQELDIKPEIEIFDSGMVHACQYYLKQGNLKAPMHFQLCLGVLGAAMATVGDLVYLQSLLPQDATWSAFGIGRAHLPIMMATIAMGGNIRVGLEDNVYYKKGVPATNQMLVERAVRIINEADKEVATPNEARKILGLKNVNK